MTAGRTPATSGRGVGTCPACGKVSYESRSDAKAAKRAIFPGDKMHAYPCGAYWHFGHDELWRELAPEDLIWKPMPARAIAQVLAMARTTFMTTTGAA